MDEEALNLEVRKFLKKVGINSQRQIEKAVHAAVDTGSMSIGESLSVNVILEIPQLEIRHAIDGEILVS